MINSIELQNFQSHKKTLIKFSPRVTSIVGSSDSGKTAILRGMKKAAKNKPGGDSFRSNWGGDTLIKIETDDEAAVTRLVTDKTNAYYLDTPNGQQKFKAFGQGVPAEIVEALNMDDENIQSQMDAPFLFSASDGEVARRLNEAANLEKIDNSQSFLLTSIKNLKADIKKNKDDLKNKEVELTATEFIEEAELLLIQLEALQQEADTRETKIVQLTSLVLDIDRAEEDLKKLSFVKEARQGYLELIEHWESGFKQGKEAGSLEEILTAIKEIDSDLADYPDISKAKSALEAISGETEGVISLESKIDAMNDLLDDLADVDGSISDIAKSLIFDQEQFDKLMPEECPLCGK